VRTSAPGNIGAERTASVTARSLARALTAAAIALLALGPLGLVGGRPAEAQERGRKAKPAPVRACRAQAPQKFLERRSYLRKGVIDPKKQARAVRYLAERYGRVDHEATERWNKQPALAQAKDVRFMGLPLSVHAKIAPALACVEKRILDTCTRKSRYTPRAVGGFRSVNTYRGSEISNHLFGIAVDIDPDRNPCCGCVDPWPSNPVCKNEGSVYKRTALPKCWIAAFERFGFDWLGHDSLEDTMHFEFLGDPARIKK
jgi:D-alanyl-D-alanine carboxypeptidase